MTNNINGDTPTINREILIEFTTKVEALLMKKSSFMVMLMCLISLGIVGILIMKSFTEEASAKTNDTAVVNPLPGDSTGQTEDKTGNKDENPSDVVQPGDNGSEYNNGDSTDIHNNEDGIDLEMDIIKELVITANYNYNSNDTVPITGPINKYVLVNKKNSLSSDFVPDKLREVNVTFSFEGWNEKRQMQDEAATQLEKLFAKALEEGHVLYAVSGYRSYARQEAIYNNNVATRGQEATDLVSAKPGQSEHQTGYAMDVSCLSVGFDLVESFGETPEGIWLAEHAHKFGFIIRYKKDTTHITGYSYEPWHVRYVGIELATYLYNNDLTLEEYYEQIS